MSDDILREYEPIRKRETNGIDAADFVSELRVCAGIDFGASLKMLRFVVFLAQAGPEAFLSGDLVSPRTYYRWLETLQRGGQATLVLDARMRQMVREYIWTRFGRLPINLAREKVLEAVGSMVGEGEARSLRAMSRQASTGVQGERSETEGREAKPSALDTGATGGSLRQATATSPEVAK